MHCRGGGEMRRAGCNAKVSLLPYTSPHLRTADAHGLHFSYSQNSQFRNFCVIFCHFQPLISN